MKVTTVKVAAESLRMIGCPNKREESIEGQTLNLRQRGSVRGEREDKERQEKNQCPENSRLS